MTKPSELRTRSVLPLALCILAMGASCSKPTSSPQNETPVRSHKPNLVLIIIDTLRADLLSCYGYQAETSPELDEFASKGVLFERVVANSSWTRPSIGTMVTSRHARALGIYDERGDILDARFTTLSEILHDEGYTTIGVTANPNINTSFGFSQGFDRYVDSRRVFDWMEGAEDPEAGKVRSRTAREVFREAIDAIGPTPNAPYYLQLNIMEMHRPGPPLREGYRAGMFFLKARSGEEAYAAALRQVSVDIKAFVDELTAMPGMDDTLFIFTSDHGEGLTDHPAIRGGKHHGYVLYESNVIVPLILYDHRRRIGARKVTDDVQLLDLAPTILDLLGIDIPKEMEGRSLESLVTGRGPKPALPEYIVTETLFRDNDKLGVYSDSLKYFENRDRQDGTAPREVQERGTKENGAATNELAQHTAEAAEMEAFLREWETVHPRTEATRRSGGLPKESVEQLKALGYLE